MTYKDIINIHGSKAVYNIEDATDNEWESFIPNDSFCNLLTKVISSISKTSQDNHKSFWVYGSFGTGKSHATAVVQHLLCDNTDNAAEWLNSSLYKTNVSLYEGICEIRKTQRLLPVLLYGLNNISNASDLQYVMQNAIQNALQKRGITAYAQSDFDNMYQHIVKTPFVWNSLMTEKQQKNILERLEECDTTALTEANAALRSIHMSIRADNTKLKTWITAIQSQIAKTSPYSGLLIIWDEFTDIMNEPFALSVLKQLQEIAEAFMDKDCSSYLFLVSLPYAFRNIDTQSLEQTNGRYHMIRYFMPNNSIVNILYSKIQITDQAAHYELRSKYDNAFPQPLASLLPFLPIHPYTILLLSFYAANIGSSNRSIFEFIGQNESFDKFLCSEQSFENRKLYTPDFLFDFIFDELKKDNDKFGLITERFNLHAALFKKEPYDKYLPVFKTVLLLNAFRNQPEGAKIDFLTPSEQNIKLAFANDPIYKNVQDALDFLNKTNIIPRTPDNLFPVEFYQIPIEKIDSTKKQIAATQFKTASQILTQSNVADRTIRFDITPDIIHPNISYFPFFDAERPSAFLSNVKNKQANAAPHNICIAFFFLLTKDEISLAKEQIKKTCANENVSRTAFVVSDEPMGVKEYNLFLNYTALKSCSYAYNRIDQASTYDKYAEDLIAAWMHHATETTATIFCRNMPEQSILLSSLSSVINNSVIKEIFPYAPTAYMPLRNVADREFWLQRNAKDIVRTIIFAKTVSEIKLKKQQQPIQAFIDCLNDDFSIKDNAEDSPIAHVCEQVNTIIKRTATSESFDLAIKLSPLRDEPFGLYTSTAASALLTFALKPHIDKMANAIKIRISENELANMVPNVFKSWDTNKRNKDLSITILQDNDSAIAQKLHNIFLPNKKENAAPSLTAVKWDIITLAKKYNLPIWCLKYVPSYLLNNSSLSQNAISLINAISLMFNTWNKNSLNKIYDIILSIDNDTENEVKHIATSNICWEEGYNNFLLASENKNVSEQTIAELKNHIKSNMPGDITYWDEESILDIIKDFQPAAFSLSTQIPQINNAKNIIANTNDINKLKKILYDICDLQLEPVLNIITTT